MKQPAESAPAPLYDVVLGGRPPDSLYSRFPTMSVRATAAQTSLRRRGSGPAQLDALLEKLGTLGLPLLDIHRWPGTGGEEQTYEVRIDGQVGEPLLHHLSWTYAVVPERTRVRIAAASGDLHQFLRACTESGASIHRVRRIDRVGVGAPA